MGSPELNRLTDEVSEATDVMASATTLIQGLAQQLRDAANDPVAINALADQLDVNANALAAAVSANTTTPAP